MCGRYANARRDADLIDAFGIDEVRDPQLEPSWNVAPTQDVRIVVEQLKKDDPKESAGRQLRTARWGLVPSWAKDPSIGSRLINARSETITEKPSFKAAAGKRRCIVPADGYYEWQKLDEAGKKKQPYYLHAEDEAPLAFAGLYEWWRDPELPDDHPERWRCTNTILTTTAADALGHVHDRSPVIVPPDMIGDWLNPDITDLATSGSWLPLSLSRTWCHARSAGRSGTFATTARSSSSRSTTGVGLPARERFCSPVLSLLR